MIWEIHRLKLIFMQNKCKQFSFQFSFLHSPLPPFDIISQSYCCLQSALCKIMLIQNNNPHVLWRTGRCYCSHLMECREEEDAVNLWKDHLIWRGVGLEHPQQTNQLSQVQQMSRADVQVSYKRFHLLWLTALRLSHQVSSWRGKHWREWKFRNKQIVLTYIRLSFYGLLLQWKKCVVKTIISINMKL